ncbi:MAG: CoA transferase [Alphaproteobacteria bacterium]|nr:CoA transferase [Alphaproteobacteria bacterium]
MSGALDGVLVISIEQAVAAPYCAARLADAGARVIKVERPEGDFARAYDQHLRGESAYFVFLNRGKESVCLDFKRAEDLALLHRLIARADVLIQNLAPGAAARAGFGAAEMRARHPRLITVDISGYGDFGPYRERRAYDLLVQAESGLASITGSSHAPGRVGISATDIGTGMYAHAAVLEALLARGHTGQGRHIDVSLFSSMAEWMAIPLMSWEYDAYDWPRLGLTHPFIAPYGVYPTGDDVPILISIQNDKEWARLCSGVLERPDMITDPRFASGVARNAIRDETNAIVAAVFRRHTWDTITAKLEAAQIAYARVSSVRDLASHPQVRRTTIATESGEVSLPALAATVDGRVQPLGKVPALGEHTEKIRAEFAA